MLELQPYFASTYAKNILADWLVLSDYIFQKSLWIKDLVQAQHEASGNVLQPSLLTNQQIDDAFNGPFQQFFSPHLHAYAVIAKINTALCVNEEDFFKESEHAIDKTLGVPESLLSKTEFSTLKQLRDQCDTLTKEHYAQWESSIKNWTELLLTEFKKNDVTLTDAESQEFATNQPASELNDRFVDLKIAFPTLKKSPFNFHQYFTLKAMLTIHSVFNRTHKPNTEKEIDQALKMLHSPLKTINRDERKLAQMQTKALDQLISGIKF